MEWEDAITQQASAMLYAEAWDLGLAIRARVEDLTQHFFEELVTVGIDVAGPPNLGEFTPYWEPLTEKWIEQKGHDMFYEFTGGLQRTLLRKSTIGIFGRPQVFLSWGGDMEQVVAARPPARRFEGVSISRIKYTIIPFPRLLNVESAEELVAGGEDSTTFIKLTNTNDARPLVTPFTRWYIEVKIRNAIARMV